MAGSQTLATRFEAAPYEYEEARELAGALELSDPVAITLVRRGYRTAEQARAFIDATEQHDFRCFEGIEGIAGAIAAAIAARRRITVHGDYDVDGISATAILVASLQARGAECDWLIPDRADGYGLTGSTIETLRQRGTGLLITADCGIASPEEVELARGAGIETIVTDHHQPGETLPDCAIVHPAVSGYPFEGLCGAAVAYKLCEALDAVDPRPGGERPQGADLDLVALATVADMVPLTGENRTLVRAGLAELRRARRPGIRALLAVAAVEPERLDEGDIAFRLGPRLNAAGRLYRADAGVELMLTEDPERATTIAGELDAANHERRTIEREVSSAAEKTRRELPEELREAKAIVLAGEGWHAGVVGIAASRIVERHGRPAVLLSIGPEGRAKGSGRSVPGFDLLAALQRCSQHLIRFGGHKAAAGMELEASSIDAFRRDFAAAAEELMPADAGPALERIDAVVGAEALGIEVAEQLGTLGPFGQGNPEVRLLVPWASVGEIRPMGAEGRHARFSLSSGSGRASGVAFNRNGALDAASRTPSDLTVKLELNHWNGAVEPRAVLAGSEPGRGAAPEATGAGPCGCGADADAGWWERFEAELAREPGSHPGAALDAAARGAPQRRVVPHGDRSAIALISELTSSGARVLVISSDARRRAALVEDAASPARFGRGHRIVCGGCPAGSLAAAAGEGPDPDGGFPAIVLTDWQTVAAEPAASAAFPHVVVVDPAPAAAPGPTAAVGPGLLHIAAAGSGELPSLCLAEQWQPRPALAEIYRGLLAAEGGQLTATGLGALLVGSGSHRRRAEVAARCVRVLGELELTRLEGECGARQLGVVSSEKTALERSGAWRAYTKTYEDGLQSLENPTAS